MSNIIKTYIREPKQLLVKPDTLFLKETTRKYPYFATSYLFLTIAQNSKESIFTSTNIDKTAIFLGDRTRLYESTHNPDWIKGHGNEFLFDAPTYSFDEPKKEETLEIETTKKEATYNRKEKYTDTLIDKFIELNPSIQKPKAEFYSPTEMASRSLEDHEEFATETLARIFWMTKNYEKAIKIYQKLSLENPQKSDYFADLIKSLKDKINE